MMRGQKSSFSLQEVGRQPVVTRPASAVRRFSTSVGLLYAGISLWLAALILSGCSMGVVGDRVGSKFKYWFALTKPIVSERLQFEDDQIFIQFRIDESFINFRIQNISTRTLGILWDRLTLAVDGRITPFKYSANAYTADPGQRAPTIVPPDAYLIDFIVPKENLQLVDGRWRERDLFPTRDLGDEEIEKTILQNVGKRVSMYLPLGSNEQVLEYLFEFEVSSVEKVDWKNYRPPRRAMMPRPSGPSAGETWTTAVLIGVFLVAAVYFVFIRKPTPEE